MLTPLDYIVDDSKDVLRNVVLKKIALLNTKTTQPTVYSITDILVMYNIMTLKGVGLGNTKMFLSLIFSFIYILENVGIHSSSATEVLMKLNGRDLSFYV